MGAISGQLTLTGLNLDSCQGDKVIMSILKEMGASPVITQQGIKFNRSILKGTTVDVSQCPDLVPAIAVAASNAEGTTSIINAARLRIKESDRLMTTRRELNNLGADITEKVDGLIIKGKPGLTGGKTFAQVIIGLLWL